MLSLYVKEYVTFMYEDCCLSKITVVITNKIVLNCAKKKEKKKPRMVTSVKLQEF